MALIFYQEPFWVLIELPFALDRAKIIGLALVFALSYGSFRSFYLEVADRVQQLLSHLSFLLAFSAHEFMI
jgi:hypothetical protein